MATGCEDKPFQQLIKNENFISKGAFGEVYACVWKNKICAVKRRMGATAENCKKEIEACEKWKSIHHENLITVYDVSLEPPALYILMEYAGGGSLKGVLSLSKSTLPLQILTDWGTQIASGMAYLHNKNIIHRDLKSENIIVMEPDAAIKPYKKTLKIIDFDQIRDNDHATVMSKTGTYAWMAPEVLDSATFAKASDVWSYGVILWEMSTREIPYRDIRDTAILTGVTNNTLKLTIPDSCPPCIRTVLGDCQLFERDDRPTFDEILSKLRDAGAESQRGQMTKGAAVSREDKMNTSFKEMETEPDPTNTSLMNKFLVVKPKDHALKPSGQVVKNDSVLDDKRLDKPARLTIREKVKHLFSKGGSTKVKTAMVVDANSGNKLSVHEAAVQHREFLEEHIEPDFGLLDKLLSNRILSRKEISEVKDKSPFHKRNSQLLDYIFEKHQVDGLIVALRDTEQKHIVNYLNGNGEGNSQYGEEWPLTERETVILDDNQGRLIDLLDLTELLGLLFSEKVIDKRQMNFISSKPNSDSKNEALLDILHRRSLRDYKLMIICLHQSQQSHVATILESGGVVMRFHVHLDGPPAIVAPAEDEIVARVTNALTGLSIEEMGRIMERVQLNVIAAKKGHSILLYIWCETVEGLFRLYELLTSGRLKDSVEQFFNQLLNLSQKVAVKDITMNDDEFERMKAYIAEVESAHSVVEREELITEMEGIEQTHSVVESEVKPMEIEGELYISKHGLCIEQNYGWLFQTLIPDIDLLASLHTMMVLNDHEYSQFSTAMEKFEQIDLLLTIISRKSAVDFQKFITALNETKQQHIAKRLISTSLESVEGKGIQQQESVPGKDEDKQGPMTPEDINAAILRDNTDFLIQHMRLRGVINKLHAAEILSDEETRYIKTLEHQSEKIDEVLTIIRNSSPENYDKFVSYLRGSSQNLVADVAEKGGLVLKLKVTHEHSANSEELEQHIVEKLNQLQDKTVPKSEEVWRFLSQLKRANIEIVSSQFEKGVVLWCWCQSLKAVEIFDNLSIMPDLKQPNLLNGLFNLLLPGKNAPTINSVYLEKHEEEVVCRTPKNECSKNNFVIGERQAFGVAILQTKVCLLCQNPSAIAVYEEGDLSKPCEEELRLKDVVTPMDMAYSKESNCLYITDKDSASVWKIAFPSSENKIERWLDSVAADPFTLSVTSDGRVVMVKRGFPSSLDIYHPYAHLLLHLDLPHPILKPNHAVETSKGSLVVSFDKVDGAQGGICEITKEGQFISRFDSMFEPIKGIADDVNKILDQLATAKYRGFNYLAIDEKDHVYACPSMAGDLEVFDSRLFLLKHGNPGLNIVHRVQYFKEQMRLVVLHGIHKNCICIIAEMTESVQ